MLFKIKSTIYEIFSKPIPLSNDFTNYDDYWKSRGFGRSQYNNASARRAKLISKHIDKNCTILDIGCGDGVLMDFLNENNQPQKIVGIDISETAILHVREKGYEAYVFDVTSDNFVEFMKNNVFDYIIITEVLEHVQEAEKVIVSIKNNFNNSVFISLPNVGFFAYRLRLLFGKFPVVLIVRHIKEHIRFWTVADFTYWCNNFGFKIDKIIVSAGLFFKPLLFLERLFPSLFASQIIYQLKKK